MPAILRACCFVVILMHIMRKAAQNIFMLSMKKIFGRLFVTLCAVLCCIVALSGSAVVQPQELYLGGFPAGFVLETTTVEVVGMCDVMTESGLKSPARDGGIKTGDIIKKINNKEVTSSEEVTEMLSAKGLKRADVCVERGGEEILLSIVPVKDVTTGKMRVGVLVRDSLSGVGTVTYIDKTNNKFGSLGHPVTDASGKITRINGGTLYGCIIYDVKKGVRGTPGELKGAFENNKIIGSAALNSKSGVFGKLSENCDLSGLTRIEKGDIDSVTPGKAVIYSTVASNKTECYDISIVKVDKNNKDNRNFVIKIEDDDLISKTGGIVQGMSGSPIVQNGKLIGAVTHVFINDPTRGYGISVENMMNAY